MAQDDVPNEEEIAVHLPEGDPPRYLSARVELAPFDAPRTVEYVRPVGRGIRLGRLPSSVSVRERPYRRLP